MQTVLSTKAIFIAHTGAAKMEREGYTYQRSQCVATVARIINPEGKAYRTNVSPKATNCGCPFFCENRICKHLVWVSEKLDEEARYDAMEEGIREALEMAQEAAERN